MAITSVAFGYIMIGLSLVPTISTQNYNSTQDLGDTCDKQCKQTCMIMNIIQTVQGDSSDMDSIATSSTCKKGIPGARGATGSKGVQGPVGPTGIPGYRGDTGGVSVVDYAKIDNMIATRVRDMFAKALPMTGCHNVESGFEKIRNKTGGVFRVYPSRYEDGTDVYCDLETDGKIWTVFQRRMDGSVSFNRTWDEYVNGFGSPEKEYWMGLEKLYRLTVYRRLVLRVDLEDWDGNRKYAEYTSFVLGGKYDKYRLRYSRYSGTAGNALYSTRFSTYDQDNDDSSGSCSQSYGFSGWWFHSCLASNLNGPYSAVPEVPAWQGVVWANWKGPTYSMKFVEMKFRQA